MAQDGDTLELLNDLVGRALKAGADAADAVDIKSIGLSHAQRLGEVEHVERSESRDLGLRFSLARNRRWPPRQTLVPRRLRKSSNGRSRWRKLCRMTCIAGLPILLRF